MIWAREISFALMILVLLAANKFSVEYFSCLKVSLPSVLGISGVVVLEWFYP